ncbi:putative UPF0389 protein [Halotydeus destructor]|nr:putative UPF0389 protein [Halotydeus destructor]
MSKQANAHSPTSLEKRILVWYKKYPSLKDVPDSIPWATLEKVKRKARIHLNIALVGVFAIGFHFLTAFGGKKTQPISDSVDRFNVDSAKRYNDSSDNKPKLSGS